MKNVGIDEDKTYYLYNRMYISQKMNKYIGNVILY